MNQLLLFSFLLINTPTALAWDLSLIGLNDPFELLHVSIFHMRAFLCIRTENKTFPTLIESTWPENFFAIRPRIFDRTMMEVDAKDCSFIQQAIITEVDDLQRLWVMDAGNEFCEPKLIVFDLIRWNAEVFLTICSDFRGKTITSMKLNPHTLCQTRYEVIFTIEGETKFWIFSMNEDSWVILDLITDMDEDYRVPVEPTEFVFVAPLQLHCSDKMGNLYTADLDATNPISLQSLGKLLGPPKSMISDPSGMLYYIVERYGSVVRWDASKSLQAEEHDVLHMSSHPIAQVFLGARGSVWVAHSNYSTTLDHCQRVLFHYILHSNKMENYLN